MKRIIIITALLAIMAGVVYADVTPVPADRAYEVEIAVRGVARTIHDGYRAEAPTTDEDIYRWRLALLVLNTTDGWRGMVTYTQAGVANGSVDWAGLSYAQIQTSIDAAWTSAAWAKYGPEPALPSE